LPALAANATLVIYLGILLNGVVLDITENPFRQIPPEIVEQGQEAILVYLQERLDGSEPQWASKLLVVGQGGVGKTCLLRALRGEEFQKQDTTRGIETDRFMLAHPTEAGVTMQLNTWDFAGQEINHATHQFFLTNRSLFLLAWNARMGYEQCKLYYWLDTIQANAPDSPVLLVATHIDQRDADLPLSDLKRKYPQIVGQWEISNTKGTGIDALRQAIAETAANLPLMGEIWPTSWIEAAGVIRALSDKHTTPQYLWELMAAQKVAEVSYQVLARWLHELGEILWFTDSEELSDTVILKPQWVTEYISKVLESEEVIEQVGIFTRKQMECLWGDLPSSMRIHFLHLMESFDLSYRTLDDREISLVVERLPLDEAEYAERWDAIKTTANCREISMQFRLNTVPAGIPTWFIARQHRFTTRTHWRMGALFAYERTDPKHLALIKSFPHERCVQLTVRGPYPQNFFALLRDGFELTLDRFPGLQVKRLVPCPGHEGQPCDSFFDYANLEKAIHRNPPVEVLQCQSSFENVSVFELLFGIHPQTQDQVRERLDEISIKQDVIIGKQDETLDELQNLRELTQREFTKSFRIEQSKVDLQCPNVFILRPRNVKDWQRAFFGQQIELQLYCQEPNCWHPTSEGGLYVIDEPAKWLQTMAPYICRLVSVLKYATPLVGPWLGIKLGTDEYEEYFQYNIELMKELVNKLPEIEEVSSDFEKAQAVGKTPVAPDEAEGAALRALRLLLDEKDPQQHWGGLKPTLTPEGHHLWLCEHHAAQYKL